MNKIEKLLKELCPNGVEFKALKEVCEVVKGQQLNKNLLLENGLYPVMNGGINPSGYWDTYNKNAQIITISQGGASAGYVNFMQTPFWAGAHCYTIEKVVEFLNYKYVYYFLKNNQNNLIKSQYGAGIPALNKIDIQTLQIPIPPLEVQEEIVKILDTFTKLEAELEAELEARRRQYEYYRNKLLSFEYLDKNGGGYELKMLGEVCEIYDGTHQTPKYTTNGIKFVSVENINNLYASEKFITQEAYNKEYLNKETEVGDVLMTRIGSIGECVVITKNENLAYYVSLALLKPNKYKVLGAFLKYYIESSNGKRELGFKIIHSAVPIKINKGDIGKIQIPIPSLKTQEKIISILDKFHALTTDLQSGIPAEIKARKKQYEYYRNKLLTFKEAI